MSKKLHATFCQNRLEMHFPGRFGVSKKDRTNSNAAKGVKLPRWLLVKAAGIRKLAGKQGQSPAGISISRGKYKAYCPE